MEGERPNWRRSWSRRAIGRYDQKKGGSEKRKPTVSRADTAAYRRKRAKSRGRGRLRVRKEERNHVP